MQDIDLASYTFFKGMKPEHIELLSKRVSQENFKPNEYIFQEKEEAVKFYLILKGKVSIETTSPEGKKFAIMSLKVGDLLGWSWLIPPHEWRFSARATETTEMLEIDGEFIREKCKKDHDLGYEVYRRLADVFVQRLEATRRQLMEMYHGV